MTNYLHWFYSISNNDADHIKLLNDNCRYLLSRMPEESIYFEKKERKVNCAFRNSYEI